MSEFAQRIPPEQLAYVVKWVDLDKLTRENAKKMLRYMVETGATAMQAARWLRDRRATTC